jgi:ribose 5-phosphate isomerase B
MKHYGEQIMKIAIGSDGVAFNLKESVKAHLISKGHNIKDFGVTSSDGDTPYYETAHRAANHVMKKEYERAILFCGTGMGMAIIANKHPGIFAAVCDSKFAAEKSRSINNSNVLTLGAFVTGDFLAKEIVDIWLETKFTQAWDPKIQEWLRNSMNGISSLEDSLFKK